MRICIITAKFSTLVSFISKDNFYSFFFSISFSLAAIEATAEIEKEIILRPLQPLLWNLQQNMIRLMHRKDLNCQKFFFLI